MLSLLVGLLRLYARSEALPDCWRLTGRRVATASRWRRTTACRLEETGGLRLEPSAVSILYSCGRALAVIQRGRRAGLRRPRRAAAEAKRRSHSMQRIDQDR